MLKLTPVLCVDKIEPCLPFWVDKLGFEKTLELPEGNELGFVILQKGDVELMMQSRASISKDIPALAKGPFESSGVGFYMEVADLAPIRVAVKDCEIVVPERTTFYGMRELGVRAPGGFLVLFATKATPREA